VLKAGDAGAEHEGREKVLVAPSFLLCSVNAIPRFPPRFLSASFTQATENTTFASRNDVGGPNSKGAIFEGPLFLGEIVRYPFSFEA